MKIQPKTGEALVASLCAQQGSSESDRGASGNLRDVLQETLPAARARGLDATPASRLNALEKPSTAQPCGGFADIPRELFSEIFSETPAASHAELRLVHSEFNLESHRDRYQRQWNTVISLALQLLQWTYGDAYQPLQSVMNAVTQLQLVPIYARRAWLSDEQLGADHKAMLRDAWLSLTKRLLIADVENVENIGEEDKPDCLERERRRAERTMMSYLPRETLEAMRTDALNDLSSDPMRETLSMIRDTLGPAFTAEALNRERKIIQKPAARKLMNLARHFDDKTAADAVQGLLIGNQLFRRMDIDGAPQTCLEALARAAVGERFHGAVQDVIGKLLDLAGTPAFKESVLEQLTLAIKISPPIDSAMVSRALANVSSAQWLKKTDLRWRLITALAPSMKDTHLEDALDMCLRFVTRGADIDSLAILDALSALSIQAHSDDTRAKIVQAAQQILPHMPYQLDCWHVKTLIDEKKLDVTFGAVKRGVDILRSLLGDDAVKAVFNARSPNSLFHASRLELALDSHGATPATDQFLKEWPRDWHRAMYAHRSIDAWNEAVLEQWSVTGLTGAEILCIPVATFAPYLNAEQAGQAVSYLLELPTVAYHTGCHELPPIGLRALTTLVPKLTKRDFLRLYAKAEDRKLYGSMRHNLFMFAYSPKEIESPEPSPVRPGNAGLEGISMQ